MGIIAFVIASRFIIEYFYLGKLIDMTGKPSFKCFYMRNKSNCTDIDEVHHSNTLYSFLIITIDWHHYSNDQENISNSNIVPTVGTNISATVIDTISKVPNLTINAIQLGNKKSQKTLLFPC